MENKYNVYEIELQDQSFNFYLSKDGQLLPVEGYPNVPKTKYPKISANRIWDKNNEESNFYPEFKPELPQKIFTPPMFIKNEDLDEWVKSQIKPLRHTLDDMKNDGTLESDVQYNIFIIKKKFDDDMWEAGIISHKAIGFNLNEELTNFIN